MLETLKQKLYFLVAWYFRIWATIRLNRWNPRIIVVTGSSGKTTLMHFVESQLKDRAKISHHANSSLGIPFDILDLHRKTLTMDEWLGLFLNAPLNAFKQPPSQNLYVVEADCDRPYEGKFLSSLLNPEVTLWISLSRTHSANFDHLVGEKFKTVEDAIAYEYGHFIEKTKKLAVIIGDSEYMQNQMTRTQATIKQIRKNEILQAYNLTLENTQFKINNQNYSFPGLQPEEIAYTIALTQTLMEYLQLPFDPTFSQLEIPTGRTSIYKGIKNTTLIDSSYNANFSSMQAILKMFEKIQSEHEWVVLGDMKELGNEAQEEHEKLALLLASMQLEKILLHGPLITNYTDQKLKELLPQSQKYVSFNTHKELLDYLQQNITGEEVILFKASQSLIFEGFIEHLLADSKDNEKLPRREVAWIEYRKARGL